MGKQEMDLDKWGPFPIRSLIFEREKFALKGIRMGNLGVDQ